MDENQKGEALPPLLIPPDQLNEETLQAVLESFVLREGTDYGAVEISLDQKINNLKKRWDREEVVLVFDRETESLTFITKEESRKCL